MQYNFFGTEQGSVKRQCSTWNIADVEEVPEKISSEKIENLSKLKREVSF